jgi:hypothetical protein
MSLLNPISLGAGLLLGGKTLREDKHNRLKRHQAEAQMLLRKQVDDASFHVSKELRDRLREVQRLLRDHFTDVAAELQRSLSESIQAAEKASNLEASGRQQRIQRIKADLAQIDTVCQAARALVVNSGTGS